MNGGSVPGSVSRMSGGAPALPGDQRDWPQQVRVDGQPQPVLAHREQPSLWLSAGSHRLEGAIAWSARPSPRRG